MLSLEIIDLYLNSISDTHPLFVPNLTEPQLLPFWIKMINLFFISWLVQLQKKIYILTGRNSTQRSSMLTESVGRVRGVDSRLGPWNWLPEREKRPFSGASAFRRHDVHWGQDDKAAALQRRCDVPASPYVQSPSPMDTVGHQLTISR